jgi:hypothetical protein
MSLPEPGYLDGGLSQTSRSMTVLRGYGSGRCGCSAAGEEPRAVKARNTSDNATEAFIEHSLVEAILRETGG